MRGWWLLAIAAFVACRAAPPQPPAPVPSRVQADTPVCVDARDVEAQITRVLVEHHAERSGLAVEVHAAPADDKFTIALRVVGRSGDVGLERSYTLGTSDCASAVALLALGVDRWLTAFPQWALPPVPPPPRPDRWLQASLDGAASASVPPLGAEGELGGFADYGGDGHRFGGSLALRTGIPHDAGTGRVREIWGLAGATWGHAFGPWQARVELRGGVLRVNGLGFAADHSEWLPWWEVVLFGGRRLGWGALGLEVAATANRDQATTTDGQVSQSIPFVRFGISATFGVYEP